MGVGQQSNREGVVGVRAAVKQGGGMGVWAAVKQGGGDGGTGSNL